MQVCVKKSKRDVYYLKKIWHLKMQLPYPHPVCSNSIIQVEHLLTHKKKDSNNERETSVANKS